MIPLCRSLRLASCPATNHPNRPRCLPALKPLRKSASQNHLGRLCAELLRPAALLIGHPGTGASSSHLSKRNFERVPSAGSDDAPFVQLPTVFKLLTNGLASLLACCAGLETKNALRPNCREDSARQDGSSWILIDAKPGHQRRGSACSMRRFTSRSVSLARCSRSAWRLR